jgi:hypothetical protein
MANRSENKTLKLPFSEGSAHLSPNFKAVFLVGGPGSGKDFLIHSSLGESNLKEISLEKLFKAILEETNIDELYNFPSVIVNGNADNKDKIIVAKVILEEMGYDTAMIYVHTSDEESKMRNDARISRGAKTFNESMRVKKYNSSIDNMHLFADMFEAFVLYDNSNNILTVNEEKKEEITGWLLELSETVTAFLAKKPTNQAALRWIEERVLEVGTNKTAAFLKALTPTTAKVRSYARADQEADKNKGGIAVANFNSPTRSVNEKSKVIKKQSFPPGNYSSTKSVALSSTGVATVPTGVNEEKPKKKKKFETSPGLAIQGDVSNFGNPSAASITAYRAESKSFKDFRTLKGN